MYCDKFIQAQLKAQLENKAAGGVELQAVRAAATAGPSGQQAPAEEGKKEV